MDDPRQIFDNEPVEPGQVAVGDFIRASGWSRARLVLHTDSDTSGPVVFLADPDERFTDKPRRVAVSDWHQRGPWVRYPNLRLLWEGQS